MMNDVYNLKSNLNNYKNLELTKDKNSIVYEIFIKKNFKFKEE